MRIPRYWASAAATEDLGAKFGRSAVKCLGWSEASLEEARARAGDALARLVASVRANDAFPDAYGYGGERPIKEEVLETLGGPSGEVEGVVTRNGYGARVLNASNLLFADIDVPEPGLGFLARMGRLFGRRAPEPDDTASIPAQVTAFVEQNASWGYRLYRTRAGWRLLVTHDLFDPASPRVQEILAQLGSDPQYMRLTRAQRCFRARLTPKPWRCGVARPLREFPRESERMERVHRDWVSEYERASDRYATCRFVAELGRGRACDTAHRLVELHDDLSRAGRPLPLA